MSLVLFSPIGNTDPIRDCYDGGCLHIVRHYHPEKVVLFFTKEMLEREERNNCYTRAIKHVAPDIEIEVIKSGIEAAHIYDEFIEVLPDAIRSYESDGTELILNLSSGTPQIKTVMAIVAVEDGLRGVQVESPNRGSNSASRPVQSDDDIEAIIANNLDDEDGAECRCIEPPLQVIRYYSEKHQIISLIERYEYAGACALAKNSVNVPKDLKKLLRHAMLREQLNTEKAEQELSQYNGVKLIPFRDEKEQELFEYFLKLQLDSSKKHLSDILVKSNNFIVELLRRYILKGTSFRLSYCLERNRLVREKIEGAYPNLVRSLDSEFNGFFRDSELSFANLCVLCRYISDEHLAKDDEVGREVADFVNAMSSLRELRNDSAHTIKNITPDDFRAKLGMSHGEFIDKLARVGSLVLGEKFGKCRNMYDKINELIRDGL